MAASRHPQVFSSLLVACLFVPVLLLVSTLKLLEYSVLNSLLAPDIEEIFITRAPAFYIILLLITLLWSFLYRMRPLAHPAWYLCGGVLTVVVAFTALTAFLPPILGPLDDESVFRYMLTEWMSLKAFAYIRWDLSFLLVVAMAFLFLLNRGSDRMHTVWRGVAFTSTFVLCLIAVLNFGYFVTTGTPGNWHLLVYTLQNALALLPVFLSELDSPRLALLLLPLFLVLGARFLAHRIQSKLSPKTTDSPLQTSVWGISILPVLLILILIPQAPAASTYPSSTYLSLFQDLLQKDSWEDTTLTEVYSKDLQLFDTANLHLVPTDSVRSMNVVVVLLESTGWNAVTPYRPELATTPFLDSLAQQSLVVERMYTNLPHTNKVMAPIFGGIYPYPSGDMYESVADAIPARGLPMLLQDFGYQSAFFTPASLEFEHKDVILQSLGFEEVYGHGDFPTEGFHPKRSFGYEDRIILKPTMDWVDTAVASGDPFFLGMLTLTPHHAYSTPPSFKKRTYEEGQRKAYLNAIRYQDDFLRDLFKGFEERGLLESTLFVLVGDHGEAFREHGIIGHNAVIYDEALRVPALIYNPVLFEGQWVGGIRHHVDIFPTLVDLLGYRIEQGTLPGTSLLAPVNPGRTTYHSAWSAYWALALHRDSLKYVYNFGRQPTQVYRIYEDPFEQRDIAATLPPEQIRTAELEMLAWRQGVMQRYHQHAGRMDVDLEEFDRRKHLPKE